MHPDDIIIAAASPPGRSLRGMIRFSGREAGLLLSHLFESTDGPGDSTVANRQRGIDAVRLRIDAQYALPALASIYRSPRSYTGEDVCELQVPGNPMLIERVIEHIMQVARERSIAIRSAEPGEFTARAYFNGRLSLTEAEGVAATIAARTDAELRAAHQLLEGRLGRIANALLDDLAHALALVEAGIDFTDQEDVVAISPRDLLARITAVQDRIAEELAHAVGTEQLESTPWIVLSGAPNAGKSSLFNALLGRERAVISDLAGTTRDVLAEPLVLDGPAGPAEVMLVDLAGLDQVDASQVNRLMQQAAADARQRAELVLQCVPCDEPDAEDVCKEREARAAARTLLVRTKCDLRDEARRIHADHDEGSDAIGVSSRTGAGLDRLRAAMASRLADRLVSLSGDMLALQPRHESALRAAQQHLREAIELITPMRALHALDDAELIAALLRAALDEIGSVAGEMTPDDVLGLIFARFCIGK